MVAAMASSGESLGSYFDIFAKEYRRPIFFCALVTIAPILYGYDGTVSLE
jgi:SP family sugar:H+ symporter-like MFS transporter